MATVGRPAHEQPLVLTVDRRGGMAVVTVAGACSMDVSAKLRDCLLELVAEKPKSIILDLTDLDFIDSSGLGALVSAHLKARHHRGTIRLVSPKPVIRDVLQITHLVQLFPIHESLASALAAVMA